MFNALILLLLLPMWSLGQKVRDISTDLCIYGGTSAGVIAAYTAANAGKKVIIIEPGGRLGGLSSGGLGQTDIGNKYVVTGVALDFYRKLGIHYGNFENWTFEPKAALALFHDYIKKAKIEVVYQHQLVNVKKDLRSIREITVTNLDQKNSKEMRIRAKIFLDCTYEGDLMAKAGVSYTVGRESNEQYGETYNGVYMAKYYAERSGKHQFPDNVSPYVVPGDPGSGLVFGVQEGTLKERGSGDKLVQAYNFRLTLTDSVENQIPISRPADYDSTKYELLARLFEAQPKKRSFTNYFIWSRMPNRKTDVNNRGAFSTDYIGGSHAYPEASYHERKKIYDDQVSYTKGLLYFYTSDPRVPGNLRNFVRKWGYPKDEFEENGHFTPQLYVREARRMVSDYVMTERNCVGKEVVPDAIAYAAYSMDSHNTQRIVVNGMVKNEGNVEVGGFPPFPISYRSIVPKRSEVDNLMVPVCLSASHIAFGSIRMEPVFMVMGQSAAVAACLAIDKGVAVQDVRVEDIHNVLKDNPKADFRKPDILVQVSDKDQIEVNGNWPKAKQRGYGEYFMLNTSTRAGEYVKFNFGKHAAPGKYVAYYYYPRRKGVTAKEIALELFDGKESRTVSLRFNNVKIVGQSSSTWVKIGEFDVQPSGSPYVKVLGKGDGEGVAANAILLVPQE
ncbi:FAD-dependent oxidoreductase [Sphingobacterium sp. SGG-5]|nr:FAD-dependent oxidoreductase [Sphingobacterium sp. SGG-5]